MYQIVGNAVVSGIRTEACLHACLNVLYLMVGNAIFSSTMNEQKESLHMCVHVLSVTSVYTHWCIRILHTMNSR